MIVKPRDAAFDLSAKGIEDFSAWLQTQMQSFKADRKSCLRVCLSAEEILLRMQEQFDESTAVTAAIDPSLRRPTLRVEIKGQPFNPLSETAEELGSWNSSLMTALGLTPKYSYSYGKNQLRLALPVKQMNPVLKTLLAFAIGCAAGLLGLWLLPDTMKQTVVDLFLSPVFDIWIKLLTAAAGPIVFLMVVTTMLNSTGITRQGGSTVHTVGRYFCFSFLLVAVSQLCTAPFFLFKEINTHLTVQELFEEWRHLLQMLTPNNIFEPFINSDTPQLFLLALLLGGVMLAAGEHVNALKNGIRQVNVLGLQTAKGFSAVVPVMVGLFLCLEIWTGQTKLLVNTWKPLLLSAGITALLLLVCVALFCVRMHVSFRVMVQKLAAPFLLTLRSGTLDETLPAAQNGCVRLLGVDANFAKVSLPQGLVLYMPFTAIGTLIFTMFAALTYDVSFNLFWLVAIVFFVQLLFVTTPPVPGANLLAFAVLFTWLGIPQQAIIDSMLFDILSGILAAAGNISLLQMETVLQAKRLGLLNTERLRQPKK